MGTTTTTRTMRKEIKKGSRDQRIGKIFGAINYNLDQASRTGTAASYNHWRNRRSSIINGLARQGRLQKIRGAR